MEETGIRDGQSVFVGMGWDVWLGSKVHVIRSIVQTADAVKQDVLVETAEKPKTVEDVLTEVQKEVDNIESQVNSIMCLVDTSQ